MKLQAQTSAIQQLERRSTHRKRGRATISENTLSSQTGEETIVGVCGGGSQTGSLLITNLLCFTSDTKELDMEEAWKKTS